MAYPTTIDTWTTKVDNVTDVMASHVNDLQTAMIGTEAATMGGNYKLDISVATNDLTVALKNLTGNDPSSTDPVIVRIGDTTRAVTAALSVTALDSTNWFNAGSTELAAQSIDYFVYLIQETGASAGTKIGFARIPYARTMNDFSATTTAQTYIKGSYTNKNATDAVALIGRFRAILGVAATYIWSLPATSVIINWPIYETDWLSYTPVVTSATGTITTVGTVAGAYKLVYNNMFFNHSGTITTNGTGASAVRISLPFIPVTDNSVCAGRENAVTGAMLQAQFNGTQMQYVTTANAYPGGDGRQIIGGGIALRMI